MKTNSKAFKRGGMAIVTVIAAIIIAILLNVIVTTINDRFPFSVDLTANSDYTINLDGEYEQYVKNVSSDIKVTVCAPEDDFEGSTYVNAMVQNCGLNVSSDDVTTMYSKYARQTLLFVKSFPAINNKISVEFRDPNSVTDFSEIKNKYSGDNLAYGDIIVSCTHKTESGEDNERYRIIKMTDIFSTEVNQSLYSQLAMYGSTYYNNLTGSNLATEMTSAIYTVTSESSVEIAVLGSHGAQTANGENSELAGLKSLLSKNNYTFTDIANPLTDEIPEDAPFVLIYQPTEDYTADEITKLSNFLINGGSYGKNLIYVASAAQPELPNLEQFLSEWGIGGLPLGGYAATTYDSSPSYLVSQPADSDYTSNYDAASTVIYPDVYRLARRTFETESRRYTTQIVTSYDTTVGRPVDADQNWKAAEATESGPFDLILMGSAYDSKGDGEKTDESHVVYFGGTYFLNQQILSADSIYNSTLTLNIFNGISGANETTETVNISPKVISANSFSSQLINNSAPTVMYIVFVGIIPVGLIAAGIIIWNRRRKRT